MTGHQEGRPDTIRDRLVEAMNSGVIATDKSGRITAWNPQAQRLLGYARDEVLGRRMHPLLHRGAGGHLSPERYCHICALLTAAPSHGDGVTFAHRDGQLVICSWSSGPIYTGDPAKDGDERGVLAGFVIVFQDAADRFVIERERRDQMDQVQRANSRLELVAGLTTVLSSTLKEEEVLQRLVQLVVPALGDWAEVDLLRPGGRIQRVTATHSELSADIADAEEPPPPPQRIPRAPLTQVLRGGTTVVITSDVDMRSGELLEEPPYELFRVTDAPNAIIAPLAARGETYGALTVGYSRPGQEYGPGDRRLVEDIGCRTGLLLANARLFAAHRETAEAMQRNLLTALPRPDDLELQARYLPATQPGWVGGDWYDAFSLPDGAIGLVIGDIVGHDLSAATRMAQVRNMLRALAWDLSKPPSTVLEHLDGVMNAVSEAEMATAVFARVEPAANRRWHLRWCNAGHPPPLLINRNGATHFLHKHGTLLCDPDLTPPRPDDTCVLPPLSTLLLYTDGLIETRDAALSDRLTRLRRICVHLAPLPLPEMCDQLLKRAEPSGEDDVALLALRLPG